MRRSLFTVAVLVSASVVVSVQGQTPAVPPAGIQLVPNAPGVIVERVLVRVNGEILTQSDLTQRQIEVLREQNRQIPDAQLQTEIAKVTPDILVSAVDDLLLVQRGREMGVKFTDEQFKQAVDNIKTQNKLDDAQLKAALAQEGLTLEQLRQQLERSYLMRAVQQREIGPSMTITQEEQRQYYDRHKERFMTPETLTLREISLAVPSTTVNGQELVDPAADAAVAARIAAIRSRATSGEDFARLVAEVSEAANKSTGGIIGPIRADDLNPALKGALTGLPPGGITEPFKAPKAYQIFKVEERSVPQLRPFDSVRGEIEQAIRDERLEPETQKMLGRLRTQAVIEWKDENYRQIYEKRIKEK
jgi:peptidyl-prolyl cis-trans isomerase SurA